MNAFKLIVAAAVAAFVAFSHSGYAQDKAAKAKAKISQQDQQLMTRLAMGDLAEIAAGRLAAERAENGEVKRYAEHMVSEHSRMLEQASNLARSKGVKPPKTADKKRQAGMKKLHALHGPAFDREYMKQMVYDHTEMLSLARKTAKEAKDAGLKQHARLGIEHIQKHLEQAKQIQSSLGSSGSAG